MTKKLENAGFICTNCCARVVPVSNGSVRNHCPFCLWSVHVDGAIPGDRASHCRAPMKPIGLTKKKKGLQVIHECTRCGKQQPNIIAQNTEQDDFDAVIEFMKSASL